MVTREILEDNLKPIRESLQSLTEKWDRAMYGLIGFLGLAVVAVWRLHASGHIHRHL